MTHTWIKFAKLLCLSLFSIQLLGSSGAIAQRFSAAENFGGYFYGIASATLDIPGSGRVLLVSPGPETSLRAYKKVTAAATAEFEDITSELFPTSPSFGATDILVTDVDGDTYPDLVYRDQAGPIGSWPTILPYLGVRIARYNPTVGRFGYPATAYFQGNTNDPDELVSAPVVVDINFDGLQDIVMTAYDRGGSQQIELISSVQYPGGGFNTLPTVLASVPYSMPLESPPLIAEGDLNYDGLEDVVIAYREVDSTTFPSCAQTKVAAYISDISTNTYSMQQVASVDGSLPDALTIDELDGSGIVSIFAALSYAPCQATGTLPPNSFQFTSWTLSSGLFIETPLTVALPHPDHVSGYASRGNMKIKIFDLDRNGLSEILASHYIDGLKIFGRTSVASQFSDISSALLPARNLLIADKKLLYNAYSSRSHPFEVADFSGDLKLDIILPFTAAHGRVLVSTNNGFIDEEYTHGVKTQSDRADSFIVATCLARFNQDSFDDLIKVDVADTVHIQFGDGTGDFGSGVTVQLPRPLSGVLRAAQDCAPIDWDRDGDLDIAIATRDASFLILNSGGATPSVSRIVAPSAVDYGARFVRSADFDLDGANDLLIASDSSIVILTPRTGAPRVLSAFSIRDSYFEDVLVRDIDLNGLLDIAVLRLNTASSVNSTDVFLFSGQTVSSTNVTFARTTIGQQIRVMALSDVDSDGAPEIAMADDVGQIAYFTAPTTFVPPALQQLSTQLGKIAFVDIDNDGDEDLVTMRGEAPFSVLFHSQDTSGFNAPISIGIPNQRVTDLEAGDFDLDGDRDLIISSNPLSALDALSITQTKLYKNLDHQLRANARTRAPIFGPAAIDIKLDSKFAGTFAFIFASMSPLAPGVQTPYGIARLTNFVSGPAAMIPASNVTSTIQVTLPNAGAFIGQSLTLQALFITPQGSAFLSTPQAVEIVSP